MAIVWVKVQFIQEEQIPVKVADYSSESVAVAEAAKVLKDRPPDKRLSAAAVTQWKYWVEGWGYQ